MSALVKFFYGGLFYLSKDLKELSYRRKSVLTKKDIDTDLLSQIELVCLFTEGVNSAGVQELWYCKSGFTLERGIQQIQGDKDILDLCSTGGAKNLLEVYVVQKGEVSPTTLLNSSKPITQKSIKQAKMLSPVPQNPGKDIPESSTLPSASFTISKKVARSSPILPSTSVTISQKTPRSSPILPSTSVKISKKPKGPVISSSEDESEDESEDDLAEEELLGSETSDDDDSSSDADYNEDVFGVETDDDGAFEENVDALVVEENINNADGEENIEDVFDVRVDSDDYRSYSTGSDQGIKVRFPEFNPLVDFKRKICLKVGMIFGSNETFRKALRQYAIEQGFDYYYLHNDGKRVSAYCLSKCHCGIKHGRKNCHCKENLCGFKACARRIGSDSSFQLKSFISEHTCLWQDKNTKMTSDWLAEKYLEHYRDDPLWRIKFFISTIKRDYGVDVAYWQAWRARMKEVLMTQGYAPEQYARVWDYAATLLKYNPGSSVFVRPEEGPERPLKFQRFYVCLKPCKEGFIAGCRPIIGLDGCHLKGSYTGQVLTAVAKDGNENIFPVAFAVVEQENKDAWCWFLQLLHDDVGSQPLTFMSDRQKGLIEALSQIVPTADTRVCVRHMHNNFKKQWPGKTYKDSVWAAAKATTLVQFKEAMKVIYDMSVDAHNYLMKQDPCTWSLHAFKHHPKSSMQLNNACESFNSCILDARQMPILSMCEWIRRKLMKMFIKKRNKMRAHQGFLTPDALEKMKDIQLESLHRCNCIGDGDLYEVDSGGRTYVVNLQARSCGCNLWDITGLPCSHAVACILRRRLNLEQFVSPYYHKETYMRAYGLSVSVMPGQDQWETTEFPPLDPPKLVIQPGRPRKSRIKEAGEKSKTKTTRVRFGKNKCGNCGVVGHTRKTCKNPTVVQEATTRPKTGGRPPRQATRPTQIQKRTYKKRKVRTMETPPSNTGAVENENDSTIQEMIESAMVEDVVIPTQVSQTTMVDAVIPTQVSQTTMPPPTSQLDPFQQQGSSSTQTTITHTSGRKKSRRTGSSNQPLTPTRITRSSARKK